MNPKNISIMGATAVVLAVILLLSWQYVGDDIADDPDDGSIAVDFTGSILSQDYESAYGMLTPEAKAAYPDAEGFGTLIQSSILAYASSYGQVTGLGDPFSEGSEYGLDIESVPVLMEQGAIRMNVFLDEGGIYLVTMGAWELPSEAQVPEGVIEDDVQVVTGDRKPLDGRLTRAEGSDRSVAVVLLQGSGPSGMDETVGPNRVFQQLAWGLAAEGVDVLRYDKRTYSDAGLTAVMGSTLTVREEYVDDALSAGRMLRDMGYGKVFIAGHSLGGTMAPYIVDASDGLFDGFVSLAGTPRSLTDLMYEQILNQLEAMPDGDLKESYLQYYAAEHELSLTIGSMTPEQLVTTTVFGASAYYWRSLEDCDVAGTVADMDCPMLFLQGSLDFQVFADEDYPAWQDVAPGHARFKLYEGLNHLFCEPGVNAGTPMEYYDELVVSPEVIRDVAAFVLTA